MTTEELITELLARLDRPVSVSGDEGSVQMATLREQLEALRQVVSMQSRTGGIRRLRVTLPGAGE